MAIDSLCIAHPSDGLTLDANSSGLWIRSGLAPIRNVHELKSFVPRTRLGRLLPTVVLQLVDLGIAELQDGGIKISHKEFARLETLHGIDAFDGIAPWAPFTVEIDTTRWPGDKEFRYFVKLYAGRQVVDPARIGGFVEYKKSVYRLDPQTYSLLEAIESFNSLPSSYRTGKEAFIRFAEVKDLAEGVGAQLDEFLTRERVIIPSAIGLDLVTEGENRISFAPKIEGVSEDSMREAFMASDEIDDVYSLSDAEGGRVRVVLDETQKEVLRRMQRVRHMGGVEKAEILRNPVALFDGVAGAVTIDFGPRVQGVGDFPFVARPYLMGSSTGMFDDVSGGQGGQRRFDAGLECQYLDGSTERVVFKSTNEMLNFCAEAKASFEAGKGVVEFRGKSIALNDSVIAALNEQLNRVSPRSQAPALPEDQGRKYLLIYTNENQIDFRVPEEIPLNDFTMQLPRSLRTGQLQDHQLVGLEWLQRNFRSDRNGCLLADDMGLGKTLQVLTFLAWAIESGELSRETPNPEMAPWDPIVIIMPVTLLESETWLENMREFFIGEGSIFRPYVSLHGTRLREFRRKDVLGRETELGQPLLDVEKLRQFRLILTNYETVVNYQHSLARMKDHISIVVTDEAQEYKTPNTKTVPPQLEMENGVLPLI